MHDPIFLSVPNVGEVRLERAMEVDHLVLADWCDLHLQGDYFFKRRHLLGILQRSTSKVFVVHVGDVMAGLLILYKGSVLHNLYLSPEVRGSGIGSAVVRHFQPQIIRAKTNMLAGDPTKFYEQAGYKPVAADPNRPWIVEMHREERGKLEPGANGQSPGQATPATPAPPAEVPPSAAPVSASPAPPAEPLAAPAALQVPRLETAMERDARLWRERKERQQARRLRLKSERQGEAAAVGLAHVARAQSLEPSKNGQLVPVVQRQDDW